MTVRRAKSPAGEPGLAGCSRCRMLPTGLDLSESTSCEHERRFRLLNIERNVQIYLGDRRPTARYTSFDYCFNHFQSHRTLDPARLASPSGMELSCLHLGFFLASWGMLRASATLLNQSIKHYAPAIDVTASVDPGVWEIDAHNYTDDSIELLEETASRLRAALFDGASNTLITKIMLGVFGCVPAFDTFFRRGFRVATFGRTSLRKVARFYEENAEVVEANRVPTLDFASGAETARQYTRAKVIDMIFFIEGRYRPRMTRRSEPARAQVDTVNGLGGLKE